MRPVSYRNFIAAAPLSFEGGVIPSAVIKAYSYDPSAKELRIKFRSEGIYVYQDVPPDTFDALNAAFSKGEFFAAHIRNNYTFRRVSGAA